MGFIPVGWMSIVQGSPTRKRASQWFSSSHLPPALIQKYCHLPIKVIWVILPPRITIFPCLLHIGEYYSVFVKSNHAHLTSFRVNVFLVELFVFLLCHEADRSVTERCKTCLIHITNIFPFMLLKHSHIFLYVNIRSFLVESF